MRGLASAFARSPISAFNTVGCVNAKPDLRFRINHTSRQGLQRPGCEHWRKPRPSAVLVDYHDGAMPLDCDRELSINFG
jgi:hypothetical protein